MLQQHLYIIRWHSQIQHQEITSTLRDDVFPYIQTG